MNGYHESPNLESAQGVNDTSTGLLQTLTDRISALERRCTWLESLIQPFYNEWGSIEDAERTHFLLHRYFDEDGSQVIPPLTKCPVHRPFYEGRRPQAQAKMETKRSGIPL